MTLISVGDLVQELSGHIDALVVDLLPSAIRNGSEWCVGSVQGEPGRSLMISRAGGKAGIWKDFSDCGRGGDALDLVAAVACGGSKADAIKWAKRWLGIDDSPGAGRRLARSAAQTQATAKQKQQSAAHAEKNRGRAHALWLQGQASIEGTPAGAYLASRGIGVTLLGRQPAALRYHPACYCTETQGPMPALLAAIHGPNNAFIGVHRTYLTEDGRKAPLQIAKKVMGAIGGGAIRLWRGKDGVPLADAAPGATVVLTEGIEDALSLALADPTRRIMAAVNLSNVGRVWFPPSVGTVIIAGDNDDNAQARAALAKAIGHLQARGLRVKAALPHPDYKDWNDFILDRPKAGAKKSAKPQGADAGDRR